MTKLHYFINSKEVSEYAVDDLLATVYDPFEYDINVIKDDIIGSDLKLSTGDEIKIEVEEIKEEAIEIANDTQLQALMQVENEIALIEADLKARKSKYEEMKQTLYEVMKEKGILKWESPNKKVLLTQVAPTTSVKQTFDEERFSKEHRDIYIKYINTKESTRNGYLKITVRKEK